jgi:hypothetical protein
MRRTWVLVATLGVALSLSFGDARATGKAALTQWLFETAREMPRSHAPGETPEEELSRLERIARGYADSVVPYADGKGWTGSELAMALWILIYEESKFDLRIHAGTGHPIWHEDHGRSKCLGQLQESSLVPRDIWIDLAGTDEENTFRCAAATAKVYVSVASRCGVWYGRRASREAVAEAFMAYGSGGKCTPDDRAYARADKWLARMQKRPDRSPLRGYRRAMPSEVILGASAEAMRLVEEMKTADIPIGFVRESRLGEKMWAFRVEHHADGKTGVSVFLKED